MKDLLYRKLKEHMLETLQGLFFLWIIVTLLFVGTALTYLGIFDFVELNEDNKTMILVLASILEAGTLLGILIAMIPYSTDYRSVKQNKVRLIDGIVNRLELCTTGTEPPETGWIPVIEDTQTGEILKTELDRDVEEGDRCLIYYLPKTKIVVLVDIISKNNI